MIERVKMSKLHFKDSSTEKSKNVIFRFKPSDDIILTLPDESGKIVTTNTISEFLKGNEAGNFINFIKKPDIRENNGGITDPEHNRDPIKVASYKTSDIFIGKHENTEWQVSYSNNFEVPAIEHAMVDDKLEWLPNVTNLGQEVFVRYRFTSSLDNKTKVVSQWSDPIRYVTPRFGAKRFSIGLEPKYSVTPTIYSGEFVIFGEDEIGVTNHIGTRFEIMNSSGVTIHRVDLGPVREYKVPSGVMEKLRTYKVKVTYLTDNDRLAETHSEYKKFETPDVYIVLPSINYAQRGSNYFLELGNYIAIHTDETHVSTSWNIYRIDSGNIEVPVITQNNDTVNKTKLDITTLAMNGENKYRAKVRFHSANIASAEAVLDFTIKPGKIKPITIEVTENSDRIPIIKLSAFDVEGEIDKIKSITISTSVWLKHADGSGDILEGFTFDYPNTGGTTFGYRAPITIEVTKEQYIEWYREDEGPAAKEVIINLLRYGGTNPYNCIFLVKAIIHGERFTTETAVVEYDPTIDTTATGSISGNELNNVKANITPGFNCTWLGNEVLGYSFDMFQNLSGTPGDWTFLEKVFYPIANGVTNLQLPKVNTLVYDREYMAKVFAKTRLGDFWIMDVTFTINSFRVDTPTLNMNVTPINTNKFKIKFTGSTYNTSNTTVAGWQQAKAVYQLAKSDDISNILFQEEVNGSSNIKEFEFANGANGITYNMSLTGMLKYVAINGKESGIAKTNFSSGTAPTVIVAKPSLFASINGNKVKLTTGSINVSGLEDKSHKATNWKLYQNTTLVWSSLNNTTDLTTIIVPNGITNGGQTYKAVASHVASDGTVSQEAEYTFTMPTSTVSGSGKVYFTDVVDTESTTSNFLVAGTKSVSEIIAKVNVDDYTPEERGYGIQYVIGGQLNGSIEFEDNTTEWHDFLGNKSSGMYSDVKNISATSYDHFPQTFSIILDKNTPGFNPYQGTKNIRRITLSGAVAQTKRVGLGDNWKKMFDFSSRQYEMKVPTPPPSASTAESHSRFDYGSYASFQYFIKYPGNKLSINGTYRYHQDNNNWATDFRFNNLPTGTTSSVGHQSWQLQVDLDKWDTEIIISAARHYKPTQINQFVGLSYNKDTRVMTVRQINADVIAFSWSVSN